MKKSLMRAAMVASLPFFAMALTVATSPAQAADKADTPKVSKAVSKQLGDCKKAIDAKDYPTAMQQFKAVVALLDDPDMGGRLSDLRTLASGFSDLSAAAAPQSAVPEGSKMQPASS